MTAADDFEALVRRQLTDVATAAFNPSQRYVTARMNAATDAIKQAAQKWGLAEYGITADRRLDLARGTDTVVHFRAGERIAVCRKWKMLDPVLTTSRQHVTCASCKRTRAYQDGD